MNDQNFNNQNGPYQLYQDQYNSNMNQAPQQPNPYADQELEMPKLHMDENFQQIPCDSRFTFRSEYDPDVVVSAQKKATVARVLALIGLISSFLCGNVTSMGLGIASLILGAKATEQCPDVDTGRDRAVAAIILGAIGLVVYIVFWYKYVDFLTNLMY